MDDTITLSSSTATADTSYTISSSFGNHYPNANVTVTGIGVPWSNTTSIGNGAYTLGPNWNNSTSGKICLDGADADIEVNGESLMATLSIIKERLNYLQVNPELEAEWEELKQLGDQYRKLEQHIRNKQATWDRLQAIPKLDRD
jgi:hypothetical protein